MVKLRLQRHGKKGKPFYHIVVADVRAPRDGRYVEKIGSYNPNTNPATILLDNEKALHWLQNGAQPTDTVRAILSYKGVLYRKYLQRGVAKGAITQEQADEQYAQWIAKKEQEVQAKRDGLSADAAAAAKERLEAETKIKEARALEIAKKNAPMVEESPAEETPTEEAATPEAETPAETATEETPASPEAETPAESSTEETPAESEKGE